MYKVHIEQFEGPLDLLLEIVEARKLSPVRISLATVAEQFIEYLRTLDGRDMEEMTQFLSVASRLALLKSRELAPSLINDDDETDIERLEEELARYRPYRRASKLLERSLLARRPFYSREPFAGMTRMFYFPKNLTPPLLAATAQKLTEQALSPRQIPQARIVPLRSLSECINELLTAMKDSKTIDFSNFLSQQKKDDRVVHFVGVLELMRQGKFDASQSGNFGTIVLTHFR
jgi:segregation and condensation protein A